MKRKVRRQKINWWKRFLKTIGALVIVLGISSAVFALPEVDTVASGNVSISYPNATTLKIDATDKAIVNYNSFSIASNEAVIVNLPSSSSSILNRVTGGTLSEIYGRLTCNGIFMLVNPAGIHIGPSAVIDVAGLVASTRDITDTNFLSSNYVFEKTSQEYQDRLLLNEGLISIREAGFGVLIAGAIENKGAIICPLGTLALVGADLVTLELAGNGLISIAIDRATAATIYDYQGKPVTEQIKNTGRLEADGGMVLLKAESIGDIFEKAINLEGYVKATKLEEHEGTVKIVTSGKVEITAEVETNTLSIEGKAIAVKEAPQVKNLELYKLTGDIYIASSITEDGLITLEGPDFKVSYLSTINLSLRSNNAINTTEGVIVQAASLTLYANKFGTDTVPLVLNAPRIYLSKLTGNIQILESQGIGSSIMLRGPPEGNLNIILPRAVSLTIEANQITLSTTIDLSVNEQTNLPGNLNLIGNYIIINGAILANGADNINAGNIHLDAAIGIYLANGSLLQARGIGQNSDGGRIIVWADEKTYFMPEAVIDVQGGTVSGDGGFVEVSSGDYLYFRGAVYAQAQNGQKGTLLLDPTSITIIDGAGPGDLDVYLPDVLYADVDIGLNTIAEETLEASVANIILESTGFINIDDLSDGVLLIPADIDITMRAYGDITFDDYTNTIQTQGTGTISLTADSDDNGVGDLTVANLTTAGGGISLSGENISIQGSLDANGGNIWITCNDITINPSVTLDSGSMNVNFNTRDAGISMGIGDDPGGGTWLLTDAEFDTITTAGGVYFWTQSPADIYIGTLSSTETNAFLWLNTDTAHVNGAFSVNGNLLFSSSDMDIDTVNGSIDITGGLNFNTWPATTDIGIGDDPGGGTWLLTQAEYNRIQADSGIGFGPDGNEGDVYIGDFTSSNDWDVTFESTNTIYINGAIDTSATNRNVVITCSDIEIDLVNGSIDAGTGTVGFICYTYDDMYIGGTQVADEYRLSNAEFNRILAAGTINFPGGGDPVNVYFDTLTAPVGLTAELRIHTTEDITINESVSLGGDVNFTADNINVNDTLSAAGNIALAAGTLISSTDSLHIESEGDITLNGDVASATLTLIADGSITITGDTNLSEVNGVSYVSADNDDSGSGNVSIANFTTAGGLVIGTLGGSVAYPQNVTLGGNLIVNGAFDMGGGAPIISLLIISDDDITQTAGTIDITCVGASSYTWIAAGGDADLGFITVNNTSDSITWIASDIDNLGGGDTTLAGVTTSGGLLISWLPTLTTENLILNGSLEVNGTLSLGDPIFPLLILVEGNINQTAGTITVNYTDEASIVAIMAYGSVNLGNFSATLTSDSVAIIASDADNDDGLGDDLTLADLTVNGGGFLGLGISLSGMTTVSENIILNGDILVTDASANYTLIIGADLNITQAAGGITLSGVGGSDISAGGDINLLEMTINSSSGDNSIVADGDITLGNLTVTTANSKTEIIADRDDSGAGDITLAEVTTAGGLVLGTINLTTAYSENVILNGNVTINGTHEEASLWVLIDGDFNQTAGTTIDINVPVGVEVSGSIIATGGDTNLYEFNTEGGLLLGGFFGMLFPQTAGDINLHGNLSVSGYIPIGDQEVGLIIYNDGSLTQDAGTTISMSNDTGVWISTDTDVTLNGDLISAGPLMIGWSLIGDVVTENITLNGYVEVNGSILYGESLPVSAMFLANNDITINPDGEPLTPDIYASLDDTVLMIIPAGDLTINGTIETEGALGLGMMLGSEDYSNNVYLNGVLNVNGSLGEGMPIALWIAADTNITMDTLAEINLLTLNTLSFIFADGTDGIGGDVILDYINSEGDLAVGAMPGEGSWQSLSRNITLNDDITVSGGMPLEGLFSLVIMGSGNFTQAADSDIVVDCAQPDGVSWLAMGGDMTIYDISTTGALGIGLDISNEELEPITDNITLNGDITVSGAVEFGEDILVSLLISCSNNLIQDPASDIVINYAQPDACSVIWAEGDMTLYQIDSTGSLILGVNLFSGEEIVVQSNNIYLNDNITVTGIPLEEFPIGLLIGANVTLIQDPSTQINVTEGTLWVIGSGDITLDYIDCAGAISIGVNFDTLEPQVNSIHLTDNLIARGSIDFGEGGPEYSLVLMALLDITQDLGTAITVTGDGISQIELDGDLTLRNIVISNGDLEITAGDDVTIATITTLGTGLPSIFFDGSTHQDATLNSNTFALIEVTNASSGTVDFLDEFTTEDFTDVTAGSHLIFNAGDTYTITGTLTLRYANLNSSDGATRFAFDVTGGDQHTYNITVANSEALTHDIYTLDSIGEELIYNNDNFDPSPHWIFIYSNPYVPPEQPPELPPDPIIEPPIDPGDPGEPMIDEDGNIVNTGAYGDEEAKRYNTPKGVIRTIVIVYEGRVVVTPYDKSGLRYDETVTLTGGQKTIQERKVSEDVQNNKL